MRGEHGEGGAKEEEEIEEEVFWVDKRAVLGEREREMGRAVDVWSISSPLLTAV